MSFLPTLAVWQFAAAGAACAAIPVILHLLNRRRYRVVEWGAMRFLREAMQRTRRIMQIRDLVLMLLRAAAVALFGLALARPFLAARQESHDAGQPVHAILLLDNSLSMAYQTLDGSLLERVKQRAAAFIERLPAGSRISVLPLAGGGAVPDPFDAKPFAVEAVRRVGVVDRSVRMSQVINRARRAVELAPELVPRLVLFGDQQRRNWDDLAALGQATDFPPLQVVQVASPEWDNSWIADVRVPDGVADAETPTTIQVVVRHHGREARRDIRAALFIRDQEVDSQLVTFESEEGTRELTFSYTFRDTQPEPGRPEFVPIRVELTNDRLPEDDVRHFVVPVVAVLPVVFVDQFGEEEDPTRNRLGETRHLRQLLAPTANSADNARQLIQIRRRRIDELDRDLLADARMVVIAGIADPGDRVGLLREYVEQGGQLVIAAGAEFDPVAWNTSGWNAGQGILPLPLAPEFLGGLPDMANRDLKPLFLSFESLGHHPYFQLAGNAEDDLRDLYAEPFFFQAVQVDAGPASIELATKAGATAESGPRWLLWSPPEADTSTLARPSADGSVALPAPPATGAAAPTTPSATGSVDFAPRILARLVSETGPAYLVERQIGRGRVLFSASGLLSSWNTLPKTNAIVLFDRILRSLLQSTLPQRNYGSVERIAVPLPSESRDDRLVLARPGEAAGTESLETGFLRTDQVGTIVEHPLARGVYRLEALGGPASAEEGTSGANSLPPAKWRQEFAVNGDEDESDLEPFAREMFDAQPVADQWRWVGESDEISLAGAGVRGQDLWWWLALGVLILLLLELVVIRWPLGGVGVESVSSSATAPVGSGTREAAA